MTPKEMLEEVRRSHSWVPAEQDSELRDAIVRAYHIGLLVAVTECQELATSSPALRIDLLRLATRLRHKAKELSRL